MGGASKSPLLVICNEAATRIDLETIDQLCRLFGCGVGDLFEYVADGDKS